ncbi:MAG TPA: Ku protein [Actinomycetota bacterium]|jgi:DNA end-binding protein Ku|nr:Ku protein [Actinomycetota bacterium]
MATAVWTGTLSFGLITLPVRLYPATQPKDVRFHLYDREGRRIRYQRVVEAEPGPASEPDEPPAPAAARDDDAAAREERALSSGSVETPVAWEDVVRGVETDEGELVTVPREELERIRPGRSRSIDIEDFVELEQIDPVTFDKSYYAIPITPEATRPYVLFHHAMREAGRIGIGRFVLRTKPHLVAIRPMEKVLAVETMFFGDEVRDPAELAPGLDGVEVDERELDLAVTLIETLKTEWDPSRYADTYREELLRMLAERSTTRRPAEEPTPASAGGSPVEELMAALKESVAAAKRDRTRKKATG